MPDVESSVIRSVRYEAAEGQLFVTFRTATVYRYDDVPAAIYEAFLAAESKGHFFTDCIRSRYDTVRLSGRSSRAQRSAA